MRIRNHLRSNIVGYIAIFMFAIGGTAYAIDGPLPGQNQVGSQDIINGEVQQPDIAAQAVGTDQIKNNQVRSPDIKTGEVQTSDVLDETLGTLDIGTNGVDDDEVASLDGDSNIDDNTLTTFDIATNAIDSDEVLDGGLNPADVDQFWAVINADGTVARDSEGIVTVTHSAGAGSYIVNFGRDIQNCAFDATIGLSGSSGTSSRGFITVVGAAASPTDSIFVTTDDIDGNSAERGFHLQVSC